MLSPHHKIELSFEERNQIESLLRSGKTEQRIALRAAIVLEAANGANNQQIADELDTSRNMVQKWRKRFALYEVSKPPEGEPADPLARLAVLHDLPRSGRPTVFSPSGSSSSRRRSLPNR